MAKKIVRLTEADLVRLTKKVISEQKNIISEQPFMVSVLDAAKNAAAAANSGKAPTSVKSEMIKCIKNNGYTHLMILTTGAGTTALGALAALFASGVGTVPAIILSAAGAIMVGIEGYLTSEGSGSASVGSELRDLYNCLKSKGVI